MDQRQVDTLFETANKMSDAVNKILRFVEANRRMLANSNTYKIEFSSVRYPLTAEQQTDMTAYYDALKAELQQYINELP